jgi:hypothetical protein
VPRITSDAVNEAIAALARADPKMAGAEIYRRLMAGELPGVPKLSQTAISVRAVQAKVSRAREEARADGTLPVNAGEEIDSLDKIMRDSLRCAEIEMTRIRNRVRSNRPKPRDPMTAKEWAKAATEIRRYFVTAQKLGPTHPSGVPTGASVTQGTTLARLAERSRERARTENADAANGDAGASVTPS